MNCEQHAALLEKLWEDAITPEEAARLREHEQSCDACARRRREAELLRDDLDAPKDKRSEKNRDLTDRQLLDKQKDVIAARQKIVAVFTRMGVDIQATLRGF